MIWHSTTYNQLYIAVQTTYQTTYQISPYLNLMSKTIYQIFTAFSEIITLKSVSPGEWHVNKTTTLENTSIHDQWSDEYMVFRFLLRRTRKAHDLIISKRQFLCAPHCFLAYNNEFILFIWGIAAKNSCLFITVKVISQCLICQWQSTR